MKLDALKQIRLSGKRPARIINLSLCQGSQFHEPVIELPSRSNFEDIDFRPLHNLAVDIHYWNRLDDVIRLIGVIVKIKPHSLYIVDHKNQACIMVYWIGETLIDDQTFLYDWSHIPYAQ
ncbi:MAG: hypothetical protein HN764_16885 [Gammaproteobacteria bacterium]|jgi:hypothetical protein|nr:hypothetical protein [Gammaproteobacteria bacterium]